MIPPPAPATAYERLRQLLKDARYDDALKQVHAADLRTTAEHDRYRQLRFACMCSDVFDYGGRYSDAERMVWDVGREAYDRLRKVTSGVHIFNATETKQECWAILHLGMSAYRRFDYERALELFQCAMKVLLLLQSRGLKLFGTLARAWYCIGLVDRERHDYRAARYAFRQCLELTEIGIEDRRARMESIVSFEYQMARCYGLGIGWIAYNEALLNEATSALIIARHLMVDKGATFISAYIDLVQASVMMSGSNDIARIDEAIRILRETQSKFSSQSASGVEHGPYTLRAENELAMAYLRRALYQEGAERDADLQEGQKSVARVQTAAKPPYGRRTSCMAYITEARILRQMSKPDPHKALACAERAMNSGSDLPFTLIDAWIGIGEAQFDLSNFRAALKAFEEALTIGKNSPKVAAVCHLHICRTYLETNQPDKAKEHYKFWEGMSGGLQNAFIDSLAEKVAKKLTAVFPDFVLKKEDLEHLPYDTYLNWLRRWLADTAMSLEGGDEDAAFKRLELQSVKTLHKWLAYERKH